MGDLVNLANRINELHADAERAASTALDYALEAGELLLQAKAEVGHGHWGGWLAAQFSGSERTAQAYMQVAKARPKIEDAKAQSPALLTLQDAVKIARTKGAASTKPTPKRAPEKPEFLPPVLDGVFDDYEPMPADPEPPEAPQDFAADLIGLIRTAHEAMYAAGRLARQATASQALTDAQDYLARAEHLLEMAHNRAVDYGFEVNL